METSLFRPSFCRAGLDTSGAEEVILALARPLLRAGLVRPGFAEAVVRREAASPTGLPLPGLKVAIPHADAEHVIAPAVAVATLRRPVAFAEMGNPASRLDVDLVALLALPDEHSAQSTLVALIQRFQDQDALRALCAAEDDAALCALLRSGEPGR